MQVAPLHLPSSCVTWATKGVHDSAAAGGWQTVVVQGRDRLGNDVAEGAFAGLCVQTIDATGGPFASEKQVKADPLFKFRISDLLRSRLAYKARPPQLRSYSIRPSIRPNWGPRC